MGWEIPWYTITDDFDADFGVGQWHGTNAFHRDVPVVEPPRRLPRRDRMTVRHGTSGDDLSNRGAPSAPRSTRPPRARRFYSSA